MAEPTTYAHGVPSWVDVGCDVEKAVVFYGELFAWDYEASGDPAETGGYGMFRQSGHDVAGIGPQQTPGPPFWSTYVTVDDVDAIAAKVTEAGGEVVMDPMDVLDAGRMAICQDPGGAFFSVWAPGEHVGAGLVNEPVSLSWNELNTRDLEGAKAFYGAVFGWACDTQDMGGGMTYTEVKLDGNPVAGMMDMTGRVPDEVPPHWLVYFAVDDTDAIAERANQLGGAVMVPPTDIPPGRFAVIGDDQGAFFAVIRLNEELRR